MSETAEHPSELFLRFSRRSMIALFAIVLLLGAAALALMLSPSHEAFRVVSLAAVAAIGVVLMIVVRMAFQRRRWAEDAPEVKAVVYDDWRRTNMNRASRAALIVALTAQYPLALIFGFAMRLPAPVGAMAMMAATITIGLATLTGLFLFFDRD
jgi:putative flippase GtrA